MSSNNFKLFLASNKWGRNLSDAIHRPFGDLSAAQALFPHFKLHVCWIGCQSTLQCNKRHLLLTQSAEHFLLICRIFDELKELTLKVLPVGLEFEKMTMQYFDVKRNSGNIFSHGPMISILTDWTLILAKCCRGNESWERILFLLRLKKKWRRKKKNDHRPCPRKERADGRNWLDVNPVDRSCSSSSVSEGNTFSSNYWFLCSSPSTCTDPCGHLCVAAAQKKKLHMKQIYTSATRHLLPHKKRGTRCADARASFSRKPTGNRTRRKSESADPDQMLTQSLRLDRIQLHFMENPC